jgi:hypothetical protein
MAEGWRWRGVIDRDPQRPISGGGDDHRSKDIMENRIAAQIIIGTGLLGAHRFSLTIAYAATNQVTAMGEINQATRRPLKIGTTLSGTYEVVESGPDSGEIITLSGRGQSWAVSENPLNVHASITIESTKHKTGFATYKYLNSAEKWVEFRRVPVKVHWIMSRDTEDWVDHQQPPVA